LPMVIVTIGAFVLLAAVYLTRSKRVVADSMAFRNSLAIWIPALVVGGRTPRHIKRFVNWLRYLCMRGLGSSSPASEELLIACAARRYSLAATNGSPSPELAAAQQRFTEQLGRDVPEAFQLPEKLREIIERSRIL